MVAERSDNDVCTYLAHQRVVSNFEHRPPSLGGATPFEPMRERNLGKSKWGLKATHSQQFTHHRLQLCTFVAFWGLSEGNFRHKMTTIVGNRGQLWTSTLSPHLLSPHLDFPEQCTSFLQMVSTVVPARTEARR